MTISLSSISIFFCLIIPTLAPGKNCSILSIHWSSKNSLWTKIIVFALVGSLSLYPTITYVLWAIPLSKGNLPQVKENLVSRLRLIINIELVGFASIPFLATLMSRGVGLG